MADNKKYYYLKLKEGFFESDELKILQAMPDGYIYSDILLKLYLKSLRSDGRLMYKGIIPYTPSILATLTNHQIGTVEKALNIFKDLGLIEILDNGAIYMLDIQNFIGKSSTEADRQREYQKRIRSEKTALDKSGEYKEICKESNKESCKESNKISVPEIRDKEIRDKEKDIKSFCPEPGSSEPYPKVETEPDTVSGPKVEIEPVQIFIELPLNNNTQFAVSEEYVKQLKELYPAVDVEQALRNMKGWLIANPSNRKTPRGIKRFINGWIAREQDRGPRRTVQEQQRRPAGNSGNRFNNFHQRQYDMGQLERELLERGKK